MNKVATVLLFINFVTVLFPQPGYIHPDEFFQSTEIVAGDILNVSHVRPWEFDSTFPVRNLVFPYLLSGPSVCLLRWMNSTNYARLKISAVKIVMATRLPMAFISLFGFLATSRLSVHFGASEYLSQVVWCSSYISWIYFTRTFSNSVEAFLLALILLIIMNILPPPRTKRSGSQVKDNENENKSCDTTKKKENIDVASKEGKRDIVHNYDGSKEPESHGRAAYVIGFVVVAGFFNRPTFLLFACVPVGYWFIYSCLSSQKLMGKTFSVIVWGSVGIFTALLLFIAADTLYYNPDFIDIISTSVSKIIEAQYSSHSFIESFNLIRSSLIITPWNFMKYNMNSDNLAEHGLHPRYTHLLVNLPLLLGPLFFPFIAASILSLIQLFRDRNTNSCNSIWLFFMAFIPVAGLSVFPHQEPRFLIPLLPIFVVLGVKLVSHMAMGKKLFIVLWIVFNVILNVIYGYVHQAAMIPALSIYQQKLSSPKAVAKLKEAGINYAFFYKTYPPPQHLFLLDHAQTHFQVHDLAGAPVKDLVRQIQTIEKQRWVSKGKNQVFVFLPSTESQRVTDLLSDYLTEYNVKMTTMSICPHLSMESLPRFRLFWKKRISMDNFIMDFCLNIISIQ